MHTLNRFLLIALLGIALVPLGGVSAALMLSREDAARQMESALGDAKDGYRQSATLDQYQQAQQRILDDAQKKMNALSKKERGLRLQIASLLSTITSMTGEAQTVAMSEQDASFQYVQQRAQLTAFVRESYARSVTADAGERTGRLVFRRLFGQSLGASVDSDLSDAAITRARRQLVLSLVRTRETAQLTQIQLRAAAGDLADELIALRKERDDTLIALRAASTKADKARSGLQLSEDQLAAVRRETAQVQSEVLRMQGELARIDARIRVRAERELIQKGLKSGYSDHRDGGDSALFSWPATGPVSAGFHNASYMKFFGVPHQGMDIVVPQGTDVRSAEDGIVFLARDGGARGFSYILIGHRDGYATLYGHLSSFAVSTGQEVTRGEVIGQSGGTPGTHGAGPMTTAAHLHFEVMKNGEHIDPRTMLP